MRACSLTLLAVRGIIQTPVGAGISTGGQAAPENLKPK